MVEKGSGFANRSVVVGGLTSGLVPVNLLAIWLVKGRGFANWSVAVNGLGNW